MREGGRRESGREGEGRNGRDRRRREEKERVNIYTDLSQKPAIVLCGNCFQTETESGSECGKLPPSSPTHLRLFLIRWH